MQMTSAPRRAIRLERSPLEPAVLGWGVALGVLLAAIGVAAGWPLTAAAPTALDLHGLSQVAAAESSLAAEAARVTSEVGELTVTVAFAVALAAWARWRSGEWDFGVLLLVVMSGSQAITGVVKLVTARDRPDDALISTLSSAFPSGHAVRAAAVYGLLAWLVLLIARAVWLRVLIASLAVVAIVTAALARVALLAHWPTDVLAGVVIGTVWLVVSIRLTRPSLVRLSPPAATGDTSGPRR